MSIMVEAILRMEYDLREGMTLEELIDEVVDQIKNGEYFASRVKDVHVTPLTDTDLHRAS